MYIEVGKHSFLLHVIINEREVCFQNFPLSEAVFLCTVYRTAAK
jgi:hypothetical protein